MEEGTHQGTRAEGPQRWDVALFVEPAEPQAGAHVACGMMHRLTAPKGGGVSLHCRRDNMTAARF